MKCMMAYCPKTGKYYGTFAGIEMWYCKQHNHIFYSFCNKKKLSKGFAEKIKGYGRKKNHNGGK